MSKGLGRGISSLMGKFEDDDDDIIVNKKSSEDVRGNVVDIDVGKIDRNPNQPRKKFDQASLQELADSIKAHGVIQPIIVTKNKDRYTIIAGERRFRATMLAGLKTIPTIVRDYDAREISEVALLENIQREDLNPIETARAIQALMDVYGCTQEELSNRIGKSRPVIANYLRLLTLCPEVIQMVEDGKLSAGHARSLVIVQDPAVQLKLAKLAVTKNVTVRDMEKAVKELQNPKKAKKAKADQSAELKELANMIERAFSTKVNIIGNDKKGRIYIDYYSRDDLDRIYNFLNDNKF